MPKVSFVQFKREIEKSGKTFFTIYDLQKFYTGNKKSLAVLLHNWKKNNLIYHLYKGLYSFDITKVDILHLSYIIDETSYISFEYALHLHNLIDQIPFTITLATQKRSKTVNIHHFALEYSHLKKDLYFGFYLQNKTYIATPEKALCDTLYLISRGKRSVDLSTLDKSKINLKKLNKTLSNFPPSTKALANKLLS